MCFVICGDDTRKLGYFGNIDVNTDFAQIIHFR